MFNIIKSISRYSTSIVIALVLTVVITIVGYIWLGGNTNIGYDIGVYNRIVLDFLNFGLVNVYSGGREFWYHKEPLRGLFYSALFWLLPITEFNHIELLQNMYFVQYIASSLLIYAVSNEVFKNKRVALVCALLFLLSIVQRNTYLLYYAKQSLALVFGLSAWYCLLKKHNLTAFLFLFVTLITHLHTSVLFSLIFFLYGSKLLKQIFMVLGFSLFAYIMFFADPSEFLHRVFYTFLQTSHTTTLGGYFFEIKTFIETQVLTLRSLVGIIFSIGFTLIHKKDKTLIHNLPAYRYYLITLYLFGWLWISFGLFNWQRHEILTDIAGVFVVGIYLHTIINNKLFIQGSLLVLISSIQLFALYGYYETIFSQYYYNSNLDSIIVLGERNKLNGAPLFIDNSLYVNHSIGFLSPHAISPGIGPFNQRSEEYRATRVSLDNPSKCKSIANSYGGVFILSNNRDMVSQCGYLVDEEDGMILGKIIIDKP